MTPIPQSPASKPYNPTIPQTLSRVVLGIGGWSSRGTGVMHAGDRCNPILLAGSTGGGGLGDGVMELKWQVIESPSCGVGVYI